ncbi:MAG: mechanosensitive ion channel family protein [Acidobacteriales bacterium]|nr:mechanosensitive ion channel family protein [Terriglobales bacterium]
MSMIEARWEPYQRALFAIAPALIAFAVTLAVAWLIRRLMLHWLGRVSTGPASFAAVAADTLATPSLLWCLAAALDVALRFAALNAVYTERAGDGIEIFVIVSFSMVAASIGVRLVASYGERRDLSLVLSGMSKTLIRVFVFSIGAMILMHKLGVSITPLLTALGVGGLAVALALQDTLANFFAGVHILVEQPISVGDYIKISTGEEGIVSDIGWRTTRLQSLNSLVVIPNTKVTSSILTNFSLPDTQVIGDVGIVAALDADPAAIAHIAMETASSTEGVLKDPAPLFLFEPGVTPTHIQAKLFFTSSSKLQQGTVASAIRMRMLERFRQEGIPLPPPTLRV